MTEYKQQIQSYVQSKKEEFSLINDYNTKVLSFGYAAFFALAAYVKTFCQGKIFIFAVLFMSVSVTFFVTFELYRSIMLNKNARAKSLALDKLPDNHPMLLIDEKQTVNYVRLQRFHPFFFFPSLISCLAAVILLFYCYIEALIG